jgi:hypothetical protein
MATKVKPRIKAGQVYWIPIEPEGSVLGLIVAAGKRYGVFMDFFRDCDRGESEADRIHMLKPEERIYSSCVSREGIKLGLWRLAGVIESFMAADWGPLQYSLESAVIPDTWFLRSYNPKSPEEAPTVRKVTEEEAKQYPTDGTMGHEAVGLVLFARLRWSEDLEQGLYEGRSDGPISCDALQKYKEERWKRVRKRIE